MDRSGLMAQYAAANEEPGRVMTENEVCVGAEALQDFTTQLFRVRGVPREDAELIAAVLVWANLRGVDSHGVLRIPGYLARIDNQLNNPCPRIVTHDLAECVGMMDADRAFGQVALREATSFALDRARSRGLALCFIRRTTHMGAIGYFALQAAQAGMAGVVIGASRPNMIYPGARRPGLATSPIAIAVPGGRHQPLLLDMASATASVGKIALARDSGLPLGEGWAVDADGIPTTDASQAAIPTPLGGHKGGGLALMFECLTSLIVANPLLAPAIDGEPGAEKHMQNGLVIAINIAQLGDIGLYGTEIDRLVNALKTLPRADGVDEILVPGERGDRVLSHRQKHGIPLPVGTWSRLRDVADPLGVSMPTSVRGTDR